MLTKDFDYNLPPELIAQTPATTRDSSRLMVVDKDVHKIDHKHFYDIVDYLGAGDLLVWNNTKVFKARLKGQVLLDEAVVRIPSLLRRGRGGLPFSAVATSATPPEPPLSKRGILNTPIVEIFLVRPMENPYVWKVLAKPGRKLRLGMKVRFALNFEGEVMMKEPDGTLLMQFAEDDIAVRAKANMYGEVPTPPYIRARPLPTLSFAKERERRFLLASADRRPSEEGERTGREVSGDFTSLYQTVYAKHEGSVAAPTAGFHFTPELIEKLEKKGVQFAEVTLHVGLGTFLPVKTEKIEDHHMHSEWVELTAKNADLINQAKSEGRRVVAVGTTTVRTLEGLAKQFDGKVEAFDGDLNLFIYPSFKFEVIDALITNFHLPKSTLLILVCAFVGDRPAVRLVRRSPPWAGEGGSFSAGREFVLRCYQEAIQEKYRFYSFGDAMLIK